MLRHVARRMPSSTRVASLFLGLALAACAGNDSAGKPDATPAPDAGVADAGAGDARFDAGPPDPGTPGHAAAALVPAGGSSASPSYRFVGTLSPGTPAASPQHKVRTGVAGATQGDAR